jgi:hypothetical protein
MVTAQSSHGGYSEPHVTDIQVCDFLCEGLENKANSPKAT